MYYLQNDYFKQAHYNPVTSTYLSVVCLVLKRLHRKNMFSPNSIRRRKVEVAGL
jgi:hypothetical protein